MKKKYKNTHTVSKKRHTSKRRSAGILIVCAIIGILIMIGGILYFLNSMSEIGGKNSLQCETYYEVEYPRICDIDSTIKLLRQSKMSLVRFGDGELNLLKGKSIRFQLRSKKLLERLKEILSSTNENIMIGIPSEAYTTVGLSSDEDRRWSKKRMKFLPVLEENINVNQVYYPTNISHLSRKMADENAIGDYFDKMRTIWQDKDIHLIHGKGIFEGFEYDIFDNAKSVTYQVAPNREAFEKYDEILAEALEVDKNKLIIIILGPTATVLAYDLGLQGYQALDLGHIAKAYDRYKRGWKEGAMFWAPDGKPE